jgi:hypothetical protein
MGKLVTPLRDDSLEVNEVAGKLIEVEVLYVTSSKPAKLHELAGRLKATFGLDAKPHEINEAIESLESQRVIRRLSNYPIDASTHSIEISTDTFSITPLGLGKLGDWIESLSEIVLTMQLGLDQRVLVSNE